MVLLHCGRVGRRRVFNTKSPQQFRGLFVFLPLPRFLYLFILLRLSVSPLNDHHLLHLLQIRIISRAHAFGLSCNVRIINNCLS